MIILLKRLLVPTIFRMEHPYIIIHLNHLFSAHMRRRVNGTCLVCLSVGYHLIINMVGFYGLI